MVPSLLLRDSVVKVLFPRSCGAQRSLEEKGEKEAKKCVRIQSIKIIVKKYIYSPHFLHQNIFRFDRISRIRITQSYCIMWSSLSSSQKVRIFAFFVGVARAEGIGFLIFDPIRFKLPVHAFSPVFKTRAAFLLTLSSLLRLRRLPLNETNRQVILVTNLMGLYYAVCILGDKIGLPIERWFGILRLEKTFRGASFRSVLDRPPFVHHARGWFLRLL